MREAHVFRYDNFSTRQAPDHVKIVNTQSNIF